jgi:hypothetical protein
LAGFLVLAQAFAAAENKESKPAKKSSTTKPGKVQVQEDSIYRKWLRKDLAFLADSNTAEAIRAKVKQFKGLEKGLEKVDKKSEYEVSEWTRDLQPKRIRIDEDTLEERIDLAVDVQRQAIRELAFIREVAIQEGAQKTTAAVEGLLLGRQERYVKIFNKMREGTNMIQRRDQEERSKRKSERNMRDRSRDRDREKNRNWEEWIRKRQVPKRGPKKQEDSTAR